jgi:hypothetical protein
LARALQGEVVQVHDVLARRVDRVRTTYSSRASSLGIPEDYNEPWTAVHKGDPRMLCETGIGDRLSGKIVGP